MLVRKIGMIIIMVVLTAALVTAETVLLSNGERISGRISEVTEQTITLETTYGSVTIDKFKIERIIFNDNSSSQSDDYSGDDRRNDDRDDDYYNRSERSEPKFRFSEEAYYSIRRRYFGASAATGIGIGLSSLGFVFTSVILFSSLWMGPWAFIYMGMCVGVPALIGLLVGLPLWIAGAVVRRNSKSEYYRLKREMRSSNYYSSTTFNKDPEVSNTMYSIPLT